MNEQLKIELQEKKTQLKEYSGKLDLLRRAL